MPVHIAFPAASGEGNKNGSTNLNAVLNHQIETKTKAPINGVRGSSTFL
jgi:hypothetical protein